MLPSLLPFLYFHEDVTCISSSCLSDAQGQRSPLTMPVSEVYGPKELSRTQLSSAVNDSTFLSLHILFSSLQKDQLGKNKTNQNQTKTKKPTQQTIKLLWRALPVNHHFKINKLIRGK